MRLIRSITRFVARADIFTMPRAEEVHINLVAWDDAVCIKTPWACLASSANATDAQMIAAIGPSFATEAEAMEHAKRLSPFAGRPANERIREEVLADKRRSGNAYYTADKYGVSIEDIYAIARGAKKAPRIPTASA